MDRAEIVSELREMSQYYEADAETFDAAIALIEPQPVTEAGLREAGFREHAAYFNCDVTETISVVYWRSTGALEVRTAARTCIAMHIADMQQLRAVIAALRGRVVVK